MDKALIDQYEAGPAKLKRAIVGLSRDELLAAPIPGKWSTQQVVIHLADAEAARYLRIKISLMIDDKSKLPAVTENQALQLKVRDVILSSLTNKTSHELINEDGKNKLRHEIQQKVAIYFRDPKLVDVMFTEFVIQL